MVGNIRSADRLIWTALGNTVNLAARLQALTREMQALVAIDAATHAAAGDAVRDFRCCVGVPIRGRSNPEDVYVLPIVGQAAAA
jgi:adenylate cyclase